MSEIPINITIEKVQCMVPVKIKFTINNADTNQPLGEAITVTGNMDYSRQELDVTSEKLPASVEGLLRAELFDHFANTALPDDFYEASEDVYNQVEQAQMEHDTVHNNHKV